MVSFKKPFNYFEEIKKDIPQPKEKKEKEKKDKEKKEKEKKIKEKKKTLKKKKALEETK